VKFVIFHIEGGIGKNIMATAVAEAIKKKYPEREIITVCSHPPVFMNNPNVYRVYQLGATPYFYEDFVKGKDSIVLKSDPYLHEDFINKKTHCIEAWCLLHNIPYNGEEPALFLTQQEEELVEQSFNRWGKPIMLLQTNGGGGPESAGGMGSWVRDMPLELAAELVEHFDSKYKILHVRTENQPALEGVDHIMTYNQRELFALVKYSHNRVVIDSFIQHASKAFGKKSTILWPVDKTKALGYSFHNNIIAEFEHQKTHSVDYYLSEDDIVGQPHMCPFPKGAKIFNKEPVIKSAEGLDESHLYHPPKGNLMGQQHPNMCNPNMRQPQMQPQPLPYEAPQPMLNL
jgi:hypothetical protein